MAYSASNVIPLAQARTSLSKLAEPIKAGAEKIISKNDESDIALVDAKRLDYYHQLEYTRVHLLALDDAGKGLADIEAGRVKDAGMALNILKQRRADKG